MISVAARTIHPVLRLRPVVRISPANASKRAVGVLVCCFTIRLSTAWTLELAVSSPLLAVPQSRPLWHVSCTCSDGQDKEGTMGPGALTTIRRSFATVLVLSAALLAGTGKAYAHNRGPWANASATHFSGGAVVQHWSLAGGAHSYGYRHGGWYGGTHRTYVHPPYGRPHYVAPRWHAPSPHPPNHAVRPRHRRFFRPYSYPWWHTQRYYHGR